MVFGRGLLEERDLWPDVNRWGKCRFNNWSIFAYSIHGTFFLSARSLTLTAVYAEMGTHDTSVFGLKPADRTKGVALGVSLPLQA